MESRRSQPAALRLVHPDRGEDATPSRQGDTVAYTPPKQAGVRKGDGAALPKPHVASSARLVERENRSAGSIARDDARWILARRAAESIEGGRAAILRPEVRRRLLSTGQRLGLRPFDANLILAIVQDDARCGGTGAGTPLSLSAEATSRLRVVRATPSAEGPSVGLLWIYMAIAFITGIVLAILGIRWFQA